MTTVDDIADVRTGDKGDTLIVAVNARDAAGYERVSSDLTSAVVAEKFGDLVIGDVKRTLLPRLGAAVFLVPGVLGAGVTGSPRLDGHGKTLSYLVATIELPEGGEKA